MARYGCIDMSDIAQRYRDLFEVYDRAVYAWGGDTNKAKDWMLGVWDYGMLQPASQVMAGHKDHVLSYMPEVVK